MSDLRRRIAALSPDRRALLEKALAGRDPAAAEPPVDPTAPSGPAPLTEGQLRLWSFDRRNPLSSHYNVPRMVSLRGPLDVAHLEAALDAVASRHEILRTVFPERDGQPVAVVRDAGPTKLPVVDLRRAVDANASLERILAEEIERPFDLRSDPMLRATLVRLDAEEHVLLASAHHIAADCWSMGMPFHEPGSAPRRWLAGVFFRELWDLYHAFAAGEPCPLPAPPRQFGDVARRQAGWLESDEARAQLAWWVETLSGAPTALEVPTDLPRPDAWDFRGARPRISLDRALTRELKALGTSCGSTLFVTLLAAFDVLLHRITGRTDVVVGTTAANRVRWDADDIVGFFSNNLVLRTDLDGDPSFLEVLERARGTAFGAFANQELPFERILEAADVGSDPSRHPLFQVRFILHEPADEPCARSGLALVPQVTGREVAKYDLTLLLVDYGDEIDGWLEYATSLYAPATVERMVSDFHALLRAAVAAPELPISRLTGAR